MKLMFALVFVWLLGWSNPGLAGGVDAAINGKMVGLYKSDGRSDTTSVSLGSDGKGGMLSRNNDGSFEQLMTFNWKVDGTTFYMSNIYFTKDGTRIIKAFSDDHFEYEFTGLEMRSRDKFGAWIIWKKVSGKPDRRVVDAFVHD